jgi:urease accessory protein
MAEKPALLVIETSRLLKAEPEVMLRAALEIGLALGNQHWPVVVKGSRVFVPPVSRQMVSLVIAEFPGISLEVASAEQALELTEDERTWLDAPAGRSHSHSHHSGDGFQMSSRPQARSISGRRISLQGAVIESLRPHSHLHDHHSHDHHHHDSGGHFHGHSLDEGSHRPEGI